MGLKEHGITRVFVPKDNQAEAALVEDVEVFGVFHLCEVLEFFSDEKGEELSMAVSVERGALQGIGAGKGTTRIVVTGNADFLDNARIDSAFGNRDFAVLTVNWLLDRTALVGNLGPRPIREYQLNMSQTQIHLLMWIMLFIIPGGVLGVGFVIWMRKRN